jgi:hypothetical protein
MKNFIHKKNFTLLAYLLILITYLNLILSSKTQAETQSQIKNKNNKKNTNTNFNKDKNINDLPDFSDIFNLFKVEEKDKYNKNKIEKKEIISNKNTEINELKIINKEKENDNKNENENDIEKNINKENYNIKKPQIKIISEIMCYYCKLLISNFLKPLLKIENWNLLLELDLIFFGNSRSKYNPIKKLYEFNCINDDKECQGNSILTCAKYNLDNNFYLNYIICIEENTKNGDFSQSNKYCLSDFPQKLSDINKCVNSSYGNEMFNNEVNLSPNNRYVPWVLINGIQNEKDQISLTNDFKGFLCNLEYNKIFNKEICGKIYPSFSSLPNNKTEIKDIPLNEYDVFVIEETGRFNNEIMLDLYVKNLIVFDEKNEYDKDINEDF